MKRLNCLLLFLPMLLRFTGEAAAPDTVLTMRNGTLEWRLSIGGNRDLGPEIVAADPSMRDDRGSRPLHLRSTGGFSIECMWTDWRAPRKANNADNPAVLTPDFFSVTDWHAGVNSAGEQETVVWMAGKEDNTLHVRLTFRLDRTRPYLYRTLAVCDSTEAGHFLRSLAPLDAVIEFLAGGKPEEHTRAIKAGGFGQPFAVRAGEAGLLGGLEYPAGVNRAEGNPDGTFHLKCSAEEGRRIGRAWTESEPAVLIVTPDTRLQYWFEQYLDGIRVAPLRPYTLYNSWYDLRSAEYPRVPAENVMNEANVMRMIRLVRSNMIEKHNIHLDAFVLDDGWDVYKSDWMLRPVQFPNGLRPVSDELNKTGTALGLWLGPTGGYSFRKHRLGWMKEHGYETVGSQMCLGGRNYSALFRKRVDEHASSGAGYFKWDGIQFSCSEPGHGHPIDLYSRRAIMDTVAMLTRSVRSLNPSMFLNITSGTWLSPWWLKYANTIWMDGEDYGYADVPSLHKRDEAITYRDFVLYDDFTQKDLWFPIANLMTHGIIKGKLEMLGDGSEPLDKFMDDVVLYAARGVSMYELYISPDILTEGEWNAIAGTLAWAKDRFSVLRHTRMIGGNPMKREPYGYIHCSGDTAILAIRNPSVEPQKLTVRLSSGEGLMPGVNDLVVERVYPTHVFHSFDVRSGDSLSFNLNGFETEVYEITRESRAGRPLLVGPVYSEERLGPRTLRYRCTGGERAIILNKESVKRIRVDDVEADAATPLIRLRLAPGATVNDVSFIQTKADAFRLSAGLNGSLHDITCAVLLTADDGYETQPHPIVSVAVNGDTAVAERVLQREGRSRFTAFPLQAGTQAFDIRVQTAKPWKGKLSIWLEAWRREPVTEVVIETKTDVPERVQLPPNTQPGERKLLLRLAGSPVVLSGK